MRVRVPVGSAINMVGPYLVSEAVCPSCGLLNTLAHIESYNSPVKFVAVCFHLRAIEWEDETDDRLLEFEVEDAKKESGTVTV